ncbi:LacI family DNA-binding transcriptional regulator [Sinobaca sp. H24]|uniref:LacI family DNA-binding transcriptional regulator n=1 Tax=Sinobaca sp. H24 TaxID=2923376 RepID=UPI00207990B2|nr:LacI family DNA-binding transcriptional regulator [Sinobaca sp. H24]
MVTIKDIAKAANVSVTTVSRALNGYDDVNEKTRQRIKDVAEKMQYSPNMTARRLVTNKSSTIGLLTSSSFPSNPKDTFTMDVISGVNEYASYADYDMILFQSEFAKRQGKTYHQLCSERQIEGVISQGLAHGDAFLQQMEESSVPCVFIDHPGENETTSFVSADNAAGAREAVRHLVSLGHREIAFINGDDEAYISLERMKGYKEGLQEADIVFNEKKVRLAYFNEEEACARSIELLEEFPEITAVFCSSDLMAMGVMRAAQQLGYQLPDELSVVGYDNLVISQYTTPALTTVHQDKYKMGNTAAELLINRLQGKETKTRVIIPGSLLVRKSTCPPRR